MAITKRQHVAKIRGHPVYSINGIVLIPCSSSEAAADAIAEANLSNGPAEKLESESESDSDFADDNRDIESLSRDDASIKSDTTQGDQSELSEQARESNVAKDVIENQGLYGRFARNWFSRKGYVFALNLVPAIASCSIVASFNYSAHDDFYTLSIGRTDTN